MKRSIGILVLMQAIFASAASAAGTVTITFSTLGATPAPSSWMLMGLGLLVAFFVFRKAHSLPGGRTMATFLMLVGISAYEVFTGNSMITKASAVIQTVTQSVTGGSSVQFVNLADDGSQQGQLVNNTGQTISLVGRTVTSLDLFVTPSGSPQCQVGMQLAPGASCYVQITVSIS